MRDLLILAVHLLVTVAKLLRSGGAYTTLAEQLRDGDQQMDSDNEEFAHRANRTMTVSTRKTAPRRRIPSCYEFATHRRFPTAGGYAIKVAAAAPGYVVRIEGQDKAGNKLTSKEWGPYPLALSAIVDLDFRL